MTDEEHQELVSRIVREVLARLDTGGSERRETAPAVAVACSATACPTVVGRLRSLEERGYRIAHAACARGASTDLVAAAQAHADDAAGDDGVLAPLPADVGALLLPELSLADAAKIALGIVDDVVSLWTWNALERDVPVIASDGDLLAGVKPGLRQRLVPSYRATCERFGVRWVATEVLSATVASSVASGVDSPTIHVPSADRRTLITEAMVGGLAAGTKEIVVPPSAVITPLARDELRRRGVDVRRRP